MRERRHMITWLLIIGKEYVSRYATQDPSASAAKDEDGNEDQDEEMSDIGSISDGE